MKPKRRQRGTGSIFRKPPCKNWVIQFYKEGKRVREASGTTEWAEAAKLLRKRLNEVDEGKYVARQRKAVRVVDLYALLKEHNEIQHKDVLDLQGRWKHLAPAFGETAAERLTTEDLSHYIRRRQTEAAADATINRELAALRRMFNVGRKYKKLQFDTRNIFFMLDEKKNTRQGFVEDEEFSRLGAEAAEPWLRTFLELAYTYGWRKGELRNLRVRHVNLKQRTLRLDPGTTKNGDGREVGMTAKVAELLRVAVSGKGPEDFVLTRDRKPVKDFRRAWRNLCVRAGVGWWACRDCGRRIGVTVKSLAFPGSRRARFEKCECGCRKRKYRGLIVHDLRRSAAKALRRAGVPESIIMETGGWRTASMFRRYAIKSSSDQRAAMEALEQARTEAERQRGENSPGTAPFAEITTTPEVVTQSRKLQ